jgi:hypothetical protein
MRGAHECAGGRGRSLSGADGGEDEDAERQQPR